jgi:hypothetical protein
MDRLRCTRPAVLRKRNQPGPPPLPCSTCLQQPAAQAATKPGARREGEQLEQLAVAAVARVACAEEPPQPAYAEQPPQTAYAAQVGK